MEVVFRVPRSQSESETPVQESRAGYRTSDPSPRTGVHREEERRPLASEAVAIKTNPERDRTTVRPVRTQASATFLQD